MIKDLLLFNLKSIGAHVLINQCTLFEKDGIRVAISGLDDYRHGSRDFDSAFLSRVKPTHRLSDPIILSPPCTFPRIKLI